MKIITIGIIDFGFGNHASVVHSLRDLDYRVRVSNNPQELDLVDALVLPGVGAFPVAMRALEEQNLDSYLLEQAGRRRPLIGICLGMQLMAGASHEHEFTKGLNLIPGEIVPFADHAVHIGWNCINFTDKNTLLANSDGQRLYFNHSFYYQGPAQYQIALTEHQSRFAAIIRHENVVGLQFHPEKSQMAGKEFLQNLITEMVDA